MAATDHMTDYVFCEGKQPKCLVVVFHGYTSSPEQLGWVINAIQANLQDADVLIPRLPLGRFSTANLYEVTKACVGLVDKVLAEPNQNEIERKYEDIYLIGHSIGGLIARKVYVTACGQLPEAPFEPELQDQQPRQWANRVRRIILLAGMNGGWKISHHFSLRSAILWTLGTWAGNLLALFRGRDPLIFEARRGAPFLTQLRIQWLVMRKHLLAEARGSAITIQLLGSVDDLVSPEDNIDLISGRDFVYLDVPKTGHFNIIEMDGTPEGKERANVFQKALVSDEIQLRKDQVPPSDLPLGTTRPDITDVIFVIHGIRDVGYWTQKIARAVRALGDQQQKKFATVTSSYGYFPMLPFLLPWRRREKVEWLMDQYATAVALYPNADFSFMGHSNGTYLLARSVRDYPCCRFRRVVFAGSVVKRTYDWEQIMRAGRVEAVLNYVATRDWLFAFFLKALQALHVQDLGSAGHDGFTEEISGRLWQIKFIRGGHSAPLTEENWHAIARFIVQGRSEPAPQPLQDSKQSW